MSRVFKCKRGALSNTQAPKTVSDSGRGQMLILMQLSELDDVVTKPDVSLFGFSSNGVQRH